MVVRAWERMRKLFFSGFRVSVGEHEKVLDMDSGDKLHNVHVLDATELYI